MCGFNGVYTFKKSKIVQAEFNSIRDSQYSRGPDDFGTYQHPKLLMGHRRLAIIDLESGFQPMYDSSNSVVIVYNGEVYNFLTLKKELEDIGVMFSTNSDTEVILEAYKYWGIELCLQKLEGMFAFALWDINTEKLFLVRDRYGEKPLYYFQDEKGVCFGSELKSIVPFLEKKEISKEALNLFFSLTYIPSPYTIYQGVLKLEPGSYLEIHKEKIEQKVYYDVLDVFQRSNEDKITSYEMAKDELRALLNSSVKQRMISDVPMGAFLSGGIDSSIIASIMAENSKHPINTFSVGFNEKEYDESPRARLVAEHIGSNHHTFIIDHKDLLEIVDDTLNYFDEPFGDSSAIPSMLLAKKTKKKVSVVLTGDVADELFGGYEKYLATYYAKRYRNTPRALRGLFEVIVNKIPHTNFTNNYLRKVKKVINSSKLTPNQRYEILCSLGYNNHEKSLLLKGGVTREVEDVILRYFKEIPGDELTKTFYSDLRLVVEGDMLVKVDRSCMMNSLEARTPFLNSEIVKFSVRLPHYYKIEKTNKKKILKEAFAHLLPAETLTFSKKGFGLPLRLWFQNELKAELLELLSPERISKDGFFNVDYIDQLLNEHFTNKQNHSSKLWLLYVFQKWLNNNSVEC